MHKHGVTLLEEDKGYNRCFDITQYQEVGDPLLTKLIKEPAHYIEERMEFLLTLNIAGLDVGQTREETIKTDGALMDSIGLIIPIYQDEAASLPEKWFQIGGYLSFAIAQTVFDTISRRLKSLP